MRLGSPAWFLDLTRGTAADRLDEGSAVRPDDGSAEAWLAQAVTRRALGEREPAADDAVLALHRGLTGVADQVLAWRICGDVRYDTGFYRDAEAAYTRAQRLDPACAAAYLGRAESTRRRRPATTAGDHAIVQADATEDQRGGARERGGHRRATSRCRTRPAGGRRGRDAEAAYLLAEVFTLTGQRTTRTQHLFVTDRYHEAIAAVSTALSVGCPTTSVARRNCSAEPTWPPTSSPRRLRPYRDSSMRLPPPGRTSCGPSVV
jgi:tetratricopeptide (TPR) repeat protein